MGAIIRHGTAYDGGRCPLPQEVGVIERYESRRLRRDIGRARATLRGEAERRDRRLREVRDTGLLFILVGGIVTAVAWGSWWVLLGVAQLLAGVWMADRPRAARAAD